MKTLTLAIGMMLFTAVVQAAPAAAPTARDLHAAQCVAALEVYTQSLAAQVKSGKEDAKPMLLNRLESGTAFVGDVYLHGDSDETQARKLANDALEAQKKLTDAQLAERQNSCADEGAKLLAASNGARRCSGSLFCASSILLPYSRLA
jgi:hypothetical protein